MLERSITTLTFLAALGSGVIGGIFFAFSTFVMAALGRMPAEQGIAAMNHINVTVLNPLFLGTFMGTCIVCALLAALTLFQFGQPGSLMMLLACLLYVVGCFGVTMVFNVPLNIALAKVTATSPEGAALWAEYLKTWTMWNHVRTVAPLAGMALLVAALMRS